MTGMTYIENPHNPDDNVLLFSAFGYTEPVVFQETSTPRSWFKQEDFAKAYSFKGRLLTLEEARAYLNIKGALTTADMWCAVWNGVDRAFVQVGSGHPFAAVGTTHR